MDNPFFKNHGPFKFSKLISLVNSNETKVKIDKEITDINDLVSAKEGEITFFHSKKYKNIAKKTKASFCLTTELLKNELPKSCLAVVVCVLWVGLLVVVRTHFRVKPNLSCVEVAVIR